MTALAHDVDYLTVPEIAARLRCGEGTAKRLCASGALEASKVAGRWLATAESVGDYVQAQSNRTQSVQRRRRRRGT